MRAFLGFCFAVACVLAALSLVSGDAWAGDLFSPEADANARARATAVGVGVGIAGAHQNQHQGQHQGQLQGQSQKSVNHNANVNVIDAHSTNYNSTYSSNSNKAYGGSSFAGSGTYGSGNSNVNVDASDDIDVPASSAPASFGTACNQGIGAQWMTGGGSANTTNPVCDWLAIADATKHSPDNAMYKAALRNAYKAAERRDNTSVFLPFFAKLRGVITLGIL